MKFIKGNDFLGICGNWHMISHDLEYQTGSYSEAVPAQLCH